MSNIKTCPQCARTYGGDDRFCTVDGAALVSGGSSLIGMVVADRFLVLEKLGEGGMGEVYLAEHVRMKRKVALKLMRPWMLGDPVAVGRFHREAEHASQISHPNVAQVFDFGETADRVVYLAMEFVDGEPLAAILARETRLHAVRCAEIAKQTAEALTAAHAMGILHRDLKPDNVMVGRARNGTDLVKLVDFGIARAMHRGTQQFTSTGMVLGTPDYMSPEQLSGDELDARSDLYALALMVFRMLTGASAFPQGLGGEAMIARLTSPPKRLKAVRPDVDWPPSLQSAFDRALAPDPKDRFADAMEFVAELDAAVSEMPLGDEEQSYLIALSQRSPTPVRGGGAVATPTRGSAQVRSDTPSPIAAVLTPPERPRMDASGLEMAVPAVTEEVEAKAALEPIVSIPVGEAPSEVDSGEAPTESDTRATRPPRSKRPLVLTAAVALIVFFAWLLNRPGVEVAPPPAAAPADSAALTALLLPPSIESAAVAVAVADSTTPGTASTDAALIATARRATLALWSSLGRGAAVLVDSSGIALTAAALVPADSAVDVFVDANTRLRATVLQVNRVTGLATLLLPMRRCRGCAVLIPDPADPAVGDSVLVLPAASRTDGDVFNTAISAFDGRTISASALPGSRRGAGVVSRKTQRLVALGGGGQLVSPAALRDALASAKALAGRVTARDSVVPIWPAATVRAATLSDGAMARVRSEIERYRVTQGDFTLLIMTPQVLKYRADLNNNPLIIPADPIRAWGAFSAYVGERRAVVALNASLKEAAFPNWPQKDVNFRGRDVRAVRLLRNDTLVVPIETATFQALTSNGRQDIRSSAIAVYSALEFRSGQTFKVEVVDARANAPQVFTIPIGALEVIRSDFSWLFGR